MNKLLSAAERIHYQDFTTVHMSPFFLSERVTSFKMIFFNFNWAESCLDFPVKFNIATSSVN